MAIVTCIPDSLKYEFPKGTHLTTDTYKIALFKAAATYDTSSTVYSSTNECSGTNYTAGGGTLTTPSLTQVSAVSYFDFDDFTFTNLTLASGNEAAGAVIYNISK
jgi:hypothetical protein